jgi:hypothetical protein
MANIRVVIQKPINSSAVGVESVTGQGVDNSDPQNPVLSFPDSDDITNNSGVTGATVSDALETLQGEQLNPNNFVNQFNTNTQGVSGRFTIQTPTDTNTSDAASVGYVLSKQNSIISLTTGGDLPNDLLNKTITLQSATDQILNFTTETFSRVGDFCQFSRLENGYVLFGLDTGVVFNNGDQEGISTSQFSKKGAMRIQDFGGNVVIDLY